MDNTGDLGWPSAVKDLEGQDKIVGSFTGQWTI